MSQNPNGPNYNPNPYGPNPNPVNPNYPMTPGTAYGSPQPSSQPPYGSNSGYPSYPPPNPPSGPNPNPNTPNSSYGPYSTPGSYAPPPPAQNPYTDPSTPSTGPYDPYAPTAMSQQHPSSPGYPPYPPVGPTPALEATPPSQPPVTPPRKSRTGLIILLVIALVILIGGSILGVLAYSSHQNTVHTDATATAQQSTAVANAQLTTTSQTATAVASIYPFSNKLVLDDPMVDNSKHVGWDSNKADGCFFSGSAYHVVQDKPNFYNTCVARSTNYTNFTFETEMVIKSGGNTAAGGLLFRADESSSKYYRLSIDTTGSYFVLVIVDTTGTGGNARILKQDTAPSFASGLGQTNTLAIVARGSQYAFYVNQQLVTSFTDSTYSHGQIGFDADYGDSPTELLFTNTKVWQLPS